LVLLVLFHVIFFAFHVSNELDSIKETKIIITKFQDLINLSNNFKFYRSKNPNFDLIEIEVLLTQSLDILKVKNA